jgi:hypothetical protein
MCQMPALLREWRDGCIFRLAYTALNIADHITRWAIIHACVLTVSGSPLAFTWYCMRKSGVHVIAWLTVYTQRQGLHCRFTSDA